MKGAIMPSVNTYAKTYNMEITAVCDPWRLAREEAAAMCKDWFGREALQYVSYRQLLDEANVDAVIIASPEHLHTTHLKAVAEAKKDVYCEKPMGKELEPLKAAYDAVKANNIVIQVGTQLRSYPAMMGARQYYATGALGKVGRIEQHRNSTRPYWYGYIREVKEEDVDWAEFSPSADAPLIPSSIPAGTAIAVFGRRRAQLGRPLHRPGSLHNRRENTAQRDGHAQHLSVER